MTEATKNPGLIQFDAVIQSGDSPGGGAWVDFPYELKETYGIYNLVSVKTTFDGEVSHGRLAKMGGIMPVLGIKKSIMEKIGKQRGNTVHVTVELDSGPNWLALPQDLLDQLKLTPELEDFVNSLSNYHKKEYVEWINSAKKEETRTKRIKKTIEILKSKYNKK